MEIEKEKIGDYDSGYSEKEWARANEMKPGVWNNLKKHSSKIKSKKKDQITR